MTRRGARRAGSAFLCAAAALGAGLGASLGAASPAFAQSADEPIPELEGVGIDDVPGAAAPLDLPFTREDGSPTTLRALWRPERPVVLVLAYYKCPMLCGLVLNALTDVLKRLPWTPGAEFDVVVASIDPSDTPALAAAKKQTFLAELGRPAAAAGWHFLTGPEASSAALASAIGFRYRYLPERDEYAHGAAIFVCTPDGRVSRLLRGVAYDAETLRLSLVEASEGKIGSPLDQLILYCYRYDPNRGRYTPVAMAIMRLGCLAFVACLALFVAGHLVRERRQAALAARVPAASGLGTEGTAPRADEDNHGGPATAEPLAPTGKAEV